MPYSEGYGRCTYLECKGGGLKGRKARWRDGEESECCTLSRGYTWEREMLTTDAQNPKPITAVVHYVVIFGIRKAVLLASTER